MGLEEGCPTARTDIGLEGGELLLLVGKGLTPGLKGLDFAGAVRELVAHDGLLEEGLAEDDAPAAVGNGVFKTHSGV